MLAPALELWVDPAGTAEWSRLDQNLCGSHATRSSSSCSQSSCVTSSDSVRVDIKHLMFGLYKHLRKKKHFFYHLVVNLNVSYTSCTKTSCNNANTAWLSVSWISHDPLEEYQWNFHEVLTGCTSTAGYFLEPIHFKMAATASWAWTTQTCR